MKIIYRANDGTDFYSESDCEAYENKKKIAAMNLKSRFFSKNGSQMDITDLDNCIENGWYMEIANIEEARFLAEYAVSEVGISLFSEPLCVGRFYWDDNTDEWHNIKELYNAYEEKLRVFEG